MNLRDRIETAANAATIVVALILSAVLVRVYFIPRSVGGSSSPQIHPGTNMRGLVTGVNWTGNGRTLVLALSTSCHFCTESAPFLQRVSREAQKHAKVLAIFPQPISDAQQYLDKASIPVDGVLRTDLGSLGVPGTPSLVLVNSDGVVTDIWVGKLTSDQGTKVLAAVVGSGVGR
jgi:hypothetical protein